MKVLLAIGAFLLVPACGHAQGAKACDDLKSEIAGKLDAKGVKGYSLDVVAKDQEVTDGKVVGMCEGGTKKVVYKKGAAGAPAVAAKEPSKQ